MLKNFSKIFLAASLGVMTWPALCSSQNYGLNTANTPYSLSNELQVETIPDYPRPNETVTINLSDYSEDLNSADITWLKDGKNVLSGEGRTSYSFVAGGAGIVTDIEIDVTLLGGASFSKSLSITPASVDLVWEANSYAPPFYQGKALHPRQGILEVVAMPEFVKGDTRISPQNLIYEWSNDVESYQDQSGYGKNVLLLNGSLLGRSENLKVLVRDPADNIAAEGFLTVNPVDPQIVFYQNDSYYGNIFDTAVNGAFNLKTDEVQIVAAPYFFTNNSRLQYDWRLNSQSLPELAGSMTVIFRKPAGAESGQSLISLSVTNPSRILQQADGSLNINFSK